MTPQEALAFLDRAVASMQGTRQDHVTGATAIQTLTEALDPPDAEIAEEDDAGHV